MYTGVREVQPDLPNKIKVYLDAETERFIRDKTIGDTGVLQINAVITAERLIEGGDEEGKVYKTIRIMRMKEQKEARA